MSWFRFLEQGMQVLTFVSLDYVESLVSSGVPTSPEEQTELMLKALRRHDEEKEEKTLTFSNASDSAVRRLLEVNDLLIYEEDAEQLNTTAVAEFQPFHWEQGEDKDTPRAKEHLQTQLSKFGVHFGRSYYRIYDVHTQKTLLSLDDNRTGKLSGGTDLLIAPYGLALESVIKQSCAVIELKPSGEGEENGLEALQESNAQATLELIAANYHSYQMTLAVLTDLSSGANIWSLQRSPSDSGDIVSVVRYTGISLNQMAEFIKKHLDLNCVPQRDYRIPLGDLQVPLRESEVVMRAMKKARVTTSGTSVVREHFDEMMEDAPLGSMERAQVLQQHWRSCGLPDSRYLSMFC